MPESLRDRLAAVLGPGNDDQTAYAQAEAVLWVLVNIDRTEMMTATSTSNGLNCANCNCALARDGDTWIHAYDGRRWCFSSPVAEPENHSYVYDASRSMHLRNGNGGQRQ